MRQVNITTSGVLSGNISQVYAIKNPLAFIYGNEPLYDWYAIDEAHQNHSLWINGAKSNFDPCPKGWKVPTDAEVTYGDFSNTTFSASGLMHTMYVGRTYNKITWFPIAGLRYYNTGALGRVGDFGSAWSASISGIYAKRLYFSTNDISSSFTNFRGYGFPVRCIQE